MARSPRKARAYALAFDAITIEGALIAPAMIARVAAVNAKSDQTPADYGVPKGLAIRDEIARYFRIGQALFVEFAAASTPSHRATVDFTHALLRDVFGFADIVRTEPKQVADRTHPITFEALSGRVPVIVVPPADELDRPSAVLSEDGRRRSAASTLQDWLNTEDAALWGFALNGDRIRLMRDNASLTRPAFIEADLRHIFQDEAFSDFAALWLLVHASRFGRAGAPVTDCALERWRDAGAREGETARDRLRDGVESALLALGNGVLSHPDNTALRARLGDGTLTNAEFFGQLLRLIYRLIFLFAAEDRDLLHSPTATPAARKLYADGYSLGRLRDRAAKRRYRDTSPDQWEGLLIVFAALARGESKLGLPALDGLFARGTLADLDAARLSNRDLMEAIYSLAWLKDASGPVPVNWRDMQTEELGSVYESLLELTPQLSNDARKFAFAEGAEAKGHARKTSGSYYTPDSLVQVLLDSALDPVLDRVTAEADDPVKALLSVTVIDPACGSGHFLLAAARRIATRVAKLRAGGLASAEDFRHALRDVVRACIHGVDRNPMAVELAKVALWIETVDPGKPLGFLDANIRCGDALFGVFDLKALEKGIPDAAYKPLAGDDKDTAKYFAKRNKDERGGQGTLDFAGGGGKLPPGAPLADAARTLRALPEGSPEEITAKRKHFEAGRAEPRSWNLRIACDLYTEAFLVPKTGGVPTNHNIVTISTTAHMWDALAGRPLYGPLVGRAQELSAAARAFHWPLEFPDVMAAGGFDAVLGNPPWEVMQLNEAEYFAQYFPEIANLPGSARKQAIASLEQNHASAFAKYQFDKRQFEATNEFSRNGERFNLTARGKVNTYSLFAELFSKLVHGGGRAGVIVPSGIATDSATAHFFSHLVSNKKIASLHDFQTGMGFFDSIGHARFKFSLLTLTGTNSGVLRPEFSFFSRTIEDYFDKRRKFTLSPDDLAKISPNTKTAPAFRSGADAELTAKIYANFPVLMDDSKGDEGNPWGIQFRQGLFNMTSDSALFHTANQLLAQNYIRHGVDWIDSNSMSRSDRQTMNAVSKHTSANATRYMPLLEAKMIHLFDHRWSTYDVGAAGDDDARYSTLVEKENPDFEVGSRYWVSDRDIFAGLATAGWNRDWLLGCRDITNAGNERTVIGSVFPATGIGNSLSIWLPAVSLGVDKIAAFLANITSLVFDYVARQKVGGTHLNFFIAKQLAILPPSTYSAVHLTFVVPRVLELTYTSHSIAPFARDLGYDGAPFKWDEDRRALLRAELDAWYARAYGLTRDELRYILDPADVMGADYPSETFRVLKKNEIAKYGEYRTARLVLQAWDAMERGETREASPPITVRTPTAAPVKLSSLPDGAWARATLSQPGDPGAAFTAILKAMDGAKSIRDVRIAAALMLEPHLLTPLLPKARAKEWRRLVGQEAVPLESTVTLFPQRAAWGLAVQNHRGNGRLIEDRDASTWAPGPGLDTFETEGWPDGRAGFVLDALKTINLDIAAESLPTDIQQWIAGAATG